MPIHINELTNGNFLDVHVSRILPQTDYECFVPKFEQFVQQHGKLRVLFADIERLAMVGDMNWRMVMALFCKPFMKATIHYFDHAQPSTAQSGH